jgi:hypothetical protein
VKLLHEKKFKELAKLLRKSSVVFKATNECTLPVVWTENAFGKCHQFDGNRKKKTPPAKDSVVQKN